MILNISPREYQEKIYETAKKYNTLVVLPTGLGKTLIALMLAVERKKAFPTSKILFLAPTKPLVEQHFEYFKKHLSELFADLQLFTGAIEAKKRQKIWNTAEIIFSTPQCVANDLEKYLYKLDEVSLLIIDEAHRCLKNYDYTKVVSFYKNQGRPEMQRILGLTASPGHEQEKIKQICNHLNIEEIEVRSRDSEDVKQYLQTLDFNKVDVEFPKEFIEIRVLLRRIYDQQTEKIRKMFPNLYPINKITLLKLQANLASQISRQNFHAMIGMSLCAQAIKISHAIELLETQTLSGLNLYLKSLLQQAEMKKSKAVQNLVKTPEFNATLISLQQLLAKKVEHPKIGKLVEIISNEMRENSSAKIMVFTQFRETASTIVNVLSQNHSIKASTFIGQAKKAAGGLSQKEQKQIIEKFKTGEINILVATSIGEEGLDIPEVNAVIFYEPIPSAIRKIQRAGRTARLAPGKLVILVTKDTRDEINHYASGAREKKMHKVISMMKDEMKREKNRKTSTLSDF